ncbi:MAG: amino acid adenylation domain-containing protein, partial [Planctomycetes bacterium]|nr:amino acid adenylation domain-containing protein [Planctomycetota bacterium]
MLNTKANQFAHYLMSLGVGTETLVGICVERSLDMVIGLLGVLKAGGAYVPLDPEYPHLRLKFMLEESEVQLLLSQSHLLERLPVSKAKVVCLDNEWQQIAVYSRENSARQSGPENLAYVLFTSGSMGKPKGVMIEQKSVVALIQWAEDTFRQEHLTGVLASTSINFDLSVYELFVTLCNGGQLFLAENALSLPTLSQSEAITLINTIPSAITELLRIEGIPNSVKVVNLAGEPLKDHLVEALYQQETIESVYNLYGPSEDTTYSTFSLILKGSDRKVNIGHPIANTKVYILDETHNPTPLGIPGELCIAGKGLARGYLNRPELTAEKFIEIEIFGKRQHVYKTGDLARWLPEGNLEFLGRLDNQIKLRGFRIELSDIEVNLSQHEAVKEAVVVFHNKKDNPCLAAYVTLAIPSGDVSGVLRTWLKARLPEYMVPTSFTVLDKLPLTPNGKFDRKALPAPDLAAFTESYVAPRTDTEQRLVEVWNHVLKQTNIGVHDNFFERGGDSIVSIQIVARARTEGLEFRPRDLFQHQTVAELAEVAQPVSTLEIDQGPVAGHVPLTPIQQAFLSRQPEEPWHFNQAILLAVPVDINEVALQEALAMILQHHDALRLRYRHINGHWQQWHETVSLTKLNDELPFHIEDLRHLSKILQTQALRERSGFWQASLNLETGPLVRLVLFNLGNESRLLWCIHHLVVDGVSWRILIEDLETAYHQAIADKPI